MFLEGNIIKSSVIFAGVALNLGFCCCIPRNEANKQCMHLSCINCECLSVQGCHTDIFIQERPLWCWVWCIILTAYVFEWDSISAWDGPKVVYECWLPFVPFVLVSELFGFSGRCQGVRFLQEFLVSFVAPD